MYSAGQIGKRLGELEERQADDLEDQWLDFKQWNKRSMSDSVDMVVEMAVCETLSEMERDLGYLERGGTGRGTYWILRHDLHGRLISSGQPDRDRRIDWEAAKTRILSVLKVRANHDEPGLSNADIRRITHLDRNQVLRLMRELKSENTEISGPGRGRYARYEIK